jgi:spermidine synthase
MLGIAIQPVSEGHERRCAPTLQEGSSHRFISRSVLIRAFLAGVLISFMAGTCSSRLRYEPRRTKHKQLVIDEGSTPLLSTLPPDVIPGRDGWNSFAAGRSTRAALFDLPEAPPTCESDDEDLLKQTFLADIENIQSAWISSQSHLVELIAFIFGRINLCIVAYTCDGAQSPNVVRCYGVSESSHVALEAWPLFGFLSIHAFAYSSASFTTVLPLLQEWLNDSVTLPRMRWALKARGIFEEGVDLTLSEAGVGRLSDDKRLVASVASDFQHIHIWDKRRMSATQLSEPPVSRELSILGLEGPLDRIVFLDDTSQSRRFGDAAYHEALVHPVMFAHDNPVRVAIIGGGEGATLREVLKHNTVKTVIMIEIDGVMVNVSREFLPEWSYCGNLVGSTDSCFDDPRAVLHVEDAIAWFSKRFGNAAAVEPDDLFDVVIMDALDPSTVVAFSDVLYKSNDLVKSLYNSLNPNGLFIIQCGPSPSLDEAPATHQRDDQVLSLLKNFESGGFDGLHAYDEAHGGFESPWTFFAVMKNRESRDSWFRNEAEVEWKIRKRAMRTSDNESPFRFFDGSTMMEWKNPNRIAAEVYCRLQPTPLSCHGGILDRQNLNALVSVENETVALENSTKMPSFGLHQWVNRVYADPSALRLVKGLMKSTGAALWNRLASVFATS